MSAKREWPEVVGMTGEEAREIILAAGIKDVFILPEGSIVTMDYSEDRVRIYVNANGIVVETPRIG